jgi:hypothetical protein
MNKETIEEAAEKFVNNTRYRNYKVLFIEGAKWQQEQDKNKYSEEDMINFANFKTNNLMIHVDKRGFYLGTNKVLEIWFEQFKKK